MSGQDQSAQAQAGGANTAPSAVAAIVLNALGHAFVLAIAGYALAAWQSFPIQTATSLAAAVGMELHIADLKWIVPVLGAALGAITGGIGGWLGHKEKVALQAEFQRLAASLGAGYSAGPDENLGLALKPFFTDIFPLQVTNVFRIASGDTRVAIAEVEYVRITKRAGSSRRAGLDPNETTRQTVAFLEPGGETFPGFTLRPEGLLLNLLADVAGIQDINFPAHPEFSKSYHLSAVHTENTRKYFDDQLLNALDRKKGLCIQSGPDGIVLYRHEQVIAPDAMKNFITDALAILGLFGKSAHSVAAAADLVPARKTDVKTLTEGTPGWLGKTLRGQFIVRADVEAFLRQPPPRTIPAKIRRQMRDDDTKVGMMVGFMLFGGGSAFVYLARDAFGSLRLLMSDQGIGVAVGSVMACVGAWIWFLCIRARFRQVTLLRSGQVSSARIVKIQRSSGTIQNDQEYLMTVAFQADGRAVEATCKVSGDARLRAQRLLRDGKPATILYHPSDTARILFTDALLRVSLEYEK